MARIWLLFDFNLLLIIKVLIGMFLYSLINFVVWLIGGEGGKVVILGWIFLTENQGYFIRKNSFGCGNSV